MGGRGSEIAFSGQLSAVSEIAVSEQPWGLLIPLSGHEAKASHYSGTGGFAPDPRLR